MLEWGVEVGTRAWGLGKASQGLATPTYDPHLLVLESAFLGAPLGVIPRVCVIGGSLVSCGLCRETCEDSTCGFLP